jgi:phenylpropionate dioxygenase-like ring-hydroxylating dioxygenase large terminal subunit
MPQAQTLDDRGYGVLPIPFGWFGVAMSDEIIAGDVRTLKYFGTEFVVWRGEDGVLNAVDPYCPHLGAHLGVGGEVVGNDLRCPYHHWEFNGEGGVAKIPYSRGVIAPRLQRSCLKTWPIAESAGVVYVWYHPNKAAPKWDVAKLPAPTLGGEWVEGERHDWIISIHVQEITENGQDYAHFPAVHGTLSPPETEFKIEGYTRRNTVEVQMQTPRGPMDGKIDVTATGPGQSITHFTDVTEVIMSQQATPIDAHTTHLRWQLYHLPNISEGKMRVTKARMRDLVKQVNQDIPIWNNKRFNAEPLLVQGDGPILAYRRQYARYYQFDEPAPNTAAA